MNSYDENKPTCPASGGLSELPELPTNTSPVQIKYDAHPGMCLGVSADGILELHACSGMAHAYLIMEMQLMVYGGPRNGECVFGNKGQRPVTGPCPKFRWSNDVSKMK